MTFASTIFNPVQGVKDPKVDHQKLIQRKKTAKYTPYNHNNPSNWEDIIARTLDVNSFDANKVHTSKANENLKFTKRIL